VQVMASLVLRLIQSALEDFQVHFVSLVILVHLNMTTDMVFVNHAQTNQLMPTTIRRPNLAISAHINAQMVLKMLL